jgi:signal transduction histidine kinase
VTASTPDSGFPELGQRWDLVSRWLPYPLLIVPLLPYGLSQRPTAGAFAITVLLAAVTAAWVAWLPASVPPWSDASWRGRVYIAGLVPLIIALNARSPWFAFFTWIGFIHSFQYLRGIWRWVASVPVAFAFSVAQSGGFHRPTPSWIGIWVTLGLVDLAMVGGFGVLGVRTSEQNEARKHIIADLAEANRRLEDMVAENTGLQAQLLTQAREAGVLEERQRMAREIHDTLAQGLTGIIAQLEAAVRIGDTAEHDRRIGNATRLARDSLAEARRSVQALRPQALEGARLPDALAAEAARWSVTSGVAAEVTTTGEPRPLHPEVEVTLLRVAQEALTNIAKHAGAGHAGVTLSYMGDVVTLDVRDDGAGFCAGQVPAADGSSGGFGLTAMRQRVQRLAGQFEIESEPGGGTAVSASVPAIPVAIGAGP